ncbi:MAG: hypothetical protein DWQ36_09535 [Acidobacteria bacterium]|mgnify:CR=1 FL=1|nr:MAG: hypothetical protein DWQ30_00815 [Acidobacteriota bacterium]REK08303.1 MAG: hypothetical protein DWQ36_09535 [Acidobacteriota bacterium]
MSSGRVVARTVRLLALSVPAALAVMTLLYWLGMRHLEGDQRTVSQSLQWAAETMTTTGYGIDGRWSHPVMVAFVVVAQFTGVALVFLVLPLALIPILERRFQTRVPTTTRLDDLLLVFRPGPELSTFLAELEGRERNVVVVETDEARARALLERGLEVVLCPDPDLLLDRIPPQRIRTLVTNGPDHESSSLIVALRRSGWSGQALALVGEAEHRRPLQLAGADLTLTPKHVLGAALASRAATRFLLRRDADEGSTGRLTDPLGAIDSRVVFSDIRVDPSSPAAGRTLAELGIGSSTGSSIIGQWRGAVFETPATATTRVAAGGILTAVGSAESLRRLQELCAGGTALRRGGDVVVYGYGKVGKVTTELLRDTGETVITVDADPDGGADLIGDVLSPTVLGRDGSNTRAVVIALDSDAKALLATLVVRDTIPGAVIVAGLREHSNADRVRAAGADTVLSLSQVTADLLLERLFGEQRIWVNNEVQLLQLRAGPSIAGRQLGELRLRERTGASLIGIGRAEGVEMVVSSRTVLQPGDDLYLSGDRAALRRAEHLLVRGAAVATHPSPATPGKATAIRSSSS